MDITHERCAGLDVHKANVVACIRVAGEGARPRSLVRTFGTATRDLEALAKWLASEEVTHVAMESTGVYWKPVWNILEDGFDLLLCNARDVKQVPGRKTDVKDCEWLAGLLQHGLLPRSFVPPREQRDLRDLCRYRAKLAAMKTSEVNRLHKVLEDANIKLSDVAADVLGASGRSMLQAIVDGESDPDRLAELAQQALRKKIPALRFALRGRIREHHRFMLRTHLEQIDSIEERISALEARIAALTAPPSPPTPPPENALLFPDAAAPKSTAAPTPAPAPASAGSPSPASSGDARTAQAPLSYGEAIRLLDTIPGVSTRLAQDIVAEIGPDMSRFPSHAHLCSWAGMCPGNNESAGKKTSSRTRKGDRWLRRALGLAASASTRQTTTVLSARYRRLSRRRGGGRALVAVGNAILRTAYFLLSARQEYHELGPDYYDRRDTERQIQYHRRRLQQLELVNPTTPPAASVA
jgi:transposase